jgi:hypothetical protein
VTYQNRDRGISTIRARKGHSCYGMGLGIMLLDDVYPGFPGDVRNASAYPFPIQYELVDGIDIQKLVFQDDKSSCLQPTLRAAERLEKLGCRAIAAECGYFAYFQKEVASHVGIPVFMSSLLQVPLIQQVIGPKADVGIVCGVRERLTPTHLRNVGIDPESNIVITGALDDYSCPHFESLWIEGKRLSTPTSHFDHAEADIVALCKDFVTRNPRIKALMFECTGFQPFARAVQRETDLPIFSWSTLLDFAYSVAVHREHYGHV